MHINISVIFRRLLLLTFGCVLALSASAETTRPMIWVNTNDRAGILEKISEQAWAADHFAAMKERVGKSVSRHGEDPESFLKDLPLVYDGEALGRHPTLARIEGNMASQPNSTRTNALPRFLMLAVDCGVLYFLTDDEAYAQCAADILHATVEALVQMEPDEMPFNGGLLYPGDHLFEARLIGAQVPVIYDFVAEYLKQGGTVYDLSKRERRSFNFDNGQEVFRTYARLAIERGIVDSNWPVLEMASLAHNVLALDDPAERSRMLAYVTHVDTPHQDSLSKVVAQYDHPGAVWPEPFGYSGAVAELTTYIVGMLLRQEAPVALPEHFLRVPLSLSRLQDFKFPNGENIRFGDGPRRSRENFEAYEIAYSIGIGEENTQLKSTFGAMIARGLEEGSYKRAASRKYSISPHPYLKPLQLLWFAPEVNVRMRVKTSPVTDELPFAGLTLQRNISPNRDPEFGLMAAVLGGHYVHAHASGMSLELYGAGEALGTPAGKGVYRSDEHENYRRLFASYNGVVVNGASRTEGGWVSLGINTVEKGPLEPAVGEAPVSKNHSFILTCFEDDRGPGAKAKQERMVGIVRTSENTGYYVDVFRSKSELPDEFHDYIYHNIGDHVTLRNEAEALELSRSPRRFLPVEGAQWISDETYLYPGWHFFKEAETSSEFAGSVVADFSANRMESGSSGMRVFIPGAAGREYSRALAPETKDAPKPYAKQATPVLVVRQKGEAWDRPFAAVYEPYGGEGNEGSIHSVETLLDEESRFAGFEITSVVEGATSVQLVLSLPAATSEFIDAERGIRFEGRYAVIHMDGAGECVSFYVGEGSRLEFMGHVLSSVSGEPTSASVEFGSGEPLLEARDSVELRLAGGGRLVFDER